MPRTLSPEDFGEPSLRVAGFQLWIHGRQFPDSTDYYDGNWLRVTAHCGASGASVWAEGAILMVTEIESFGQQCHRLLRGDVSIASLDPIEPELHLAINSTDTIGHLQVHVEITSDHLSQRHVMEFEIDQSYLPHVIGECARIVEEYPVRGQLP